MSAGQSWFKVIAKTGFVKKGKRGREVTKGEEGVVKLKRDSHDSLV